VWQAGAAATVGRRQEPLLQLLGTHEKQAFGTAVPQATLKQAARRAQRAATAAAMAAAAKAAARAAAKVAARAQLGEPEPR
jgi:hypothetical protein